MPNTFIYMELTFCCQCPLKTFLWIFYPSSNAACQVNSFKHAKILNLLNSIFSRKLFITYIFIYKETKNDRRFRPKSELLFNIPGFLKSLLPTKKGSWAFENESAPIELNDSARQKEVRFS